MIEPIVLAALVTVAIIGAGSIWIAWYDGYDKGYEDRSTEYATVASIRSRNPETAPGYDVPTIDPIDGGRNDR